MKKFFLALCAIIMGMAANAEEYYLVGNGIGWNASEAGHFTLAEDGTYVLDYEGTLLSGFKINNGSWTTGVNYGSNGSNLVLGEAYSMNYDGDNIAVESSIANPHCVLDVNNWTLTITTSSAPVESKISYAIHGQVFTGSWESRDMTEAENGTWTLTANLQAGEFGIQKLDNGSQIGWISAANGLTEAVVNIAMDASTSGTNWKSTLAGQYTFVFNPTEMTLTIQGETPVDPDPVDPDPVDPVYSYGIHGSVFTGSWETREMTAAEDGTWTLTATLQAGQFGIMPLKDGKQDNNGWIAAANGMTEAVVGIAMTATSENCSNWVSALAGEYTFVFNPTEMTLTIQGKTPVDPDPVDPDPVDPVYSYGIHGSVFTGSWETREMTEAEDGTWTLTATLVAGEFGIMPLKDGKQDNNGWIAAANGMTEAVVGIAMTATSENCSNWVSTLAGEYTFVFNPTEMTLTIQGKTPVDPDPVDPDPVDPELPAHVYIVGNLACGNWATATAPELTFAEDTKLFTIENIEIKASGDKSTTGYFSFITVQGSDWDTTNSGDRYGAPEKDALLTVPSTTNVTLFKAGVNASAANSWKVEAGYYDIVLDLANMTINIIESDSSAADIELGNEVVPVYFNLQGVQVAEPAAGLYIEVRGNQVRKVMIK